MPSRFEYRIDGGSPVDAGTGLSVNVTGLTAATEYDFEVRKKNASGSTSAWSAVRTVTTDAGGGSETVVWQGKSNVTDTSGDLMNITPGTRSTATSTQTIDSTDATKAFEFVHAFSNTPYAGFYIGFILTSGGNVPATSGGPARFLAYLDGNDLRMPPNGNQGTYLSPYDTTSVIRIKFDASRHLEIYNDGVLQITSSAQLDADTYSFAFFGDNDPSNAMGLTLPKYITGL